MTSSSSTTLWRFAALTLFGLVPLLLVGLTAMNVVDTLAAHEECATERAALATLTARLQRHPRASLSPNDIASLYLASPTEGLALAELQTRMQALVHDSGGRLQETQPAEREGAVVPGSARLHLSLDIDNAGLRDLLYATEAGLPLVTVEDLSVRKPETSDDGLADKLLKVEMTVASRFRPRS